MIKLFGIEVSSQVSLSIIISKLSIFTVNIKSEILFFKLLIFAKNNFAYLLHSLVLVIFEIDFELFDCSVSGADKDTVS
jgi:hypothetical protein